MSKLYKFLFSVYMNWIKSWKKMLNLAVTNSKMSAHIIYKILFFFFSLEFHSQNLGVLIIHEYLRYLLGTLSGTSECFHWGHKGDELYWTVTCWAHLIFFKCYLLGLSQIPRFDAYLTLPYDWGSYSLSETSWTICLLYCDQLRLHLSQNKCFWLLLQCYGPI